MKGKFLKLLNICGTIKQNYKKTTSDAYIQNYNRMLPQGGTAVLGPSNRGISCTYTDLVAKCCNKQC